MWSAIVEKLDRLRSIDRQCRAFGASSHRYALRPRATAAVIESAERRLGVPLPESLRSYYTQVADGGAGPHYGLLPAAKLEGLHPAVPYPGAKALRKLDPTAGSLPDHPHYFEAPEASITGLVAVIQQGCGHRTCLVATPGPRGPAADRVVDVSNDGYVIDTNQTLPDLFHQWLDGELAAFDAVRRWMDAGKSFSEIQGHLAAEFGRHDAGDRIASIADVTKPESLFGPANNIHHGATQFPWYDQVLRKWQARRPAPQ